MKKFFRFLIFFVILVVLLILLGYVGYLAYIDTNSASAKEYLVDKYDFDEDKLVSSNYVEYIYEDIADCESLWIKKCTSEENLLYEYTFKYNNDTIIVVKEDKKGNLTDDYEGNN